MTRRLAASLFLLIGLAVLLASCVQPVASPTASFSLEPSAGMSPLLVRFDGSASSAPDGDIAQYAWDFGDGLTGSGLGTAHTYIAGEEREYTVVLTVTDGDGRQASVNSAVTVYPEPSPAVVSVEFAWPFHFDASGEDAANLNDEYFALQNTGDVSVDMGGWTVENERGVSYRFPTGFTLHVGAFVYVHSGGGLNTAGILYWNASDSVWHNNTDIAILRNADGDIVDVYAYASC